MSGRRSTGAPEGTDPPEDARKPEDARQPERSSLRAAGRDAFFGRLSAGLVHEVKNPLMAITYNVRWCRDRLGEVGLPAAERRDIIESLDAISEAVALLERIVGDVAWFSGPDRFEPQASRLDQVVDSALRLTRHAIASVAELETEHDGVALAAMSPARLAQVVVNLLGNAADAVRETGRYGRITVRTGPGPGEDETFLEVEDDGAGVPAHMAGSLFDAFVTSKAPGRGSGLGLTISRQLVEEAGGRLELCSAGQPSRFRVVLPRA